MIDSNRIETGMFKIGYGLDSHDKHTEWEVSGKIILKGTCSVGHGCTLFVGSKGVLTFGGNVKITGDSTIVCWKSVSIGTNSLLSWDILIMDTDFHHIYNENGEIENLDESIEIGEHVWIGCRNTILKGSKIAKDNIIAANSLISGQFTTEGNIIGGINKILKTKVTWKE